MRANAVRPFTIFLKKQILRFAQDDKQRVVLKDDKKQHVILKEHRD